MKLFVLKKLLLHRIIFVVLILASTIFVMFSLCSYNSQDSSYFFYTSSGASVSSSAGSYGARMAALLFFLFGSAAMLLIPLLLFTAYLVVCKKNFRQEWERFVSYILLIPIGATLLTIYSIDFLQSPYPGGAVGHLFSTRLIKLFDLLPSIIFLQSMLLICIMLIARFSFMGIVHYGVKTIQYSIHMILHYRIIQRGAWLVYSICSLLFIRPIIMLVQFFKKLFDGSLLQATNLMTPEDEQDNAEALIQLYETLKVADKKLQLHNNNEQNVTLAKYDETSSTYNSKELLIYNDQNTHEVNDGTRKQPLPDDEHQFGVKELGSKELSSKDYVLPSLTIFIVVDDEQNDDRLKKELETDAYKLQEKLERFGVLGKVVTIKRGPVITLFEYKPQIDTKLSKILALEDDLALALQAMSIRIIAPIPGRAVVGFEVANKKRKSVSLAQVIQSNNYQEFLGSLPLILGENTVGNTVMVDLARMPHLLIAGSTGSGKSVALNAMLMSLLCKLGPDELKLILIDPKRLEFAIYTDIAHLLFPIVTDSKRAVPVLRWVVNQMEERYEKMATSGARNIVEYNEHIDLQKDERLPFIVVVIDELSDLMITAGKDVEHSITRIAQMARAAGIHMIVATQRPSVDVITGLIKVNFPSRISFRVTSRVDSRTILDCIGAEKLLGSGDMLFLDITNSQLERVHGAYVSDYEIRQVVDHIRSERLVSYLDFTQEFMTDQDESPEIDDHLYQDILKFLQEIDEVSISLFQRRFRIGYNRSARIIDRLESHGLIMPPDKNKMRKVIR